MANQKSLINRIRFPLSILILSLLVSGLCQFRSVRAEGAQSANSQINEGIADAAVDCAKFLTFDEPPQSIDVTAGVYACKKWMPEEKLQVTRCMRRIYEKVPQLFLSVLKKCLSGGLRRARRCFMIVASRSGGTDAPVWA